MKFLLQSTLANPKDWEEYDASDWRALPKKPAPGRSDEIDDKPGWCHGINVQGVTFSADHYFVESIANGGVRVTMINDDPVDYPVGTRYARVWDFLPLAEDRNFGNAYNTRQSQVVYHEGDNVKPGTPQQNTTFRPWSQFVPPRVEDQMHGKLVTNEQHKQHCEARASKGWRDGPFTEGVPEEQLDERTRRLKQQKPQQRYKPNKGTRVYYLNSTALVNPLHAAQHEVSMVKDPAAPVTLQATVDGGDDDLGFTFVTPSNEPNQGVWTTGNYRAQLDCTAAGGDMIYGMLTLAGSVGHFGRVNAAIGTEIQQQSQVEAAFSGTGLKLGTTGSVSWIGTTQTDRFEVVVACEHTGGGMDMAEDVDLELNEADDFADGPWPGVALTPTTAVATWTVLSPTVALRARIAPSPAVATWTVLSPTVRLRRELTPGVAVATWNVLPPTVLLGERGIGGDLIVPDVIEKTIVVPD